MTISAINASGRVNKTLPAGRYRLSGLLRSEWTKMRTVRSTMWTLGATVVLAIGLSIIASIETRIHWTPGNAVGFDATSVSLIGMIVAQFTIGILGVLVMSAEYGTGTIRATLAAGPRRQRMLAAKATVFGVVTLAISEAVAFIAYFVGQSLLTKPALHTTIGSPGALRAVAGSGLYVFLLGMFALGLATIIRHTAGAISAFIGTLLVLPIIVQALPGAIANKILPFLPTHIGQSVISLQRNPNTFAPWPSLALLAGYAAASLVIGGMLLAKRDA
jgi:ABC-type transport system involved in multi-copper enzyme maturation permease subunit